MYLSANELVGLTGMPGTVQGVRSSLKKVVLNSPNMQRRREGSKAFEYHIDCLPSETQLTVRENHFSAILHDSSQQDVEPKPLNTNKAQPSVQLDLLRQCPALLESKLGELTEKQKGIADSRMALVMEVLRLECQAGLRRIRAIRLIVSQAQEGILPAHLLQHVEKANARKGAFRTIGERSLNQWVVDYLRAEDSAERLMLLSPGHHKAKKAQDIAWLPMFLVIYRQPKGESVAECYRKFCKQWAEVYADQPAMLGAVPLIDAVQRALDKLPKSVLLRGRVTGAAWRSLQTYVKRDWSQLTVNDVWIGDGHGLKMKVAHPIHGQPFIPEVTMILDGVTRYVVGWSVSLSENTVAVADALRYGMSRNGLPLFYYSDNGGGEKNKIFDADVTGIFPRLGIGHELGIPGNPQGRGIIERAHKTILYRIAAQFATFHGSSADRDHVRITSRQINSAVNAQNQGKELNATQRNAMAKLPSWNQLIDALEDGIEWYNTQHRHSELPKKNGKHYTPAEYRAELLEGKAMHYLSDIELNNMFMPQVTRTAQRGWVQLFNNDYFSESLINVDGELVTVSFDIHDASKVIIRQLDGTFVCEAKWNGNKRAAFPVARIDQQRQKRVEGMEKRAQLRIDTARAELRPALEEANPDFSTLLSDVFVPQENPEELFLFESERDEFRANQQKHAIGGN